MPLDVHRPGDHPAFAGHFPGLPVLPGAVLLDEALHVLEQERGIDPIEWRVASAKFLDPVRPGDALRVEHSASADVIRFTVRVAKPGVASQVWLGQLRPEPHPQTAPRRRHPRSTPSPHEL